MVSIRDLFLISLIGEADEKSVRRPMGYRRELARRPLSIKDAVVDEIVQSTSRGLK
jgi:hypothetical protein